MSHAVRQAGGIVWEHIEDGHPEVGPRNCFPPYCSTLPDFLWLSYRAAGREIACVPFFLNVFIYSLITAIGETFVLQTEGRLRINAGSERASQTEEGESVMAECVDALSAAFSYLLPVPRKGLCYPLLERHLGFIITKLLQMFGDLETTVGGLNNVGLTVTPQSYLGRL